MPNIKPGRSMVQQMEMLRHRIRNMVRTEETGASVFAVTSLEKGEGVTTVATNLAAILAEDSKGDVLLIDGNAEGKGVEKAFRQRDPIGVVSLPHDSEPNAWPVMSATDNLDVLSVTKTSSEEGSKPFFTGLNGSLAQAKNRYRYTIIDSPPLGKMYHSMDFFRKVDGVVLVIEAERVRIPVLERAVDTLQDCGANVLGAVLNKRRFPIPKFLYKRL